MIVVDASVWVSSVIEGDVNYHASDQWLYDWFTHNNLIYVPGIIVPEVSGAVTRRTADKNAGLLALDLLLSNPAVQIVDIDAELAESSARIAIQCVLRGADAIYVALASKLDIPLITWDREQLVRACDVIETFQPPHESPIEN